jgi:hypothetical protein
MLGSTTPTNEQGSAATTAAVFDPPPPPPPPPPTPLLVSHVHLAVRFLIWPLVCTVFNILIFATLVVFDVSSDRNYHSVSSASSSSHVVLHASSSGDDGTGPSDQGAVSEAISMLRYNAMVSLIVFILDALILRYATRFLERALAEADVEGRSNSVHVSVQVSKMLKMLSLAFNAVLRMVPTAA